MLNSFNSIEACEYYGSEFIVLSNIYIASSYPSNSWKEFPKPSNDFLQMVEIVLLYE